MPRSREKKTMLGCLCGMLCTKSPNNPKIGEEKGKMNRRNVFSNALFPFFSTYPQKSAKKKENK